MYPKSDIGLIKYSITSVHARSESNIPVKLRDGVRLGADEVVEPVGGIRVDEAVADPLGCLDAARKNQVSVRGEMRKRKQTSQTPPR